jgi:hypothetical protein
VTVLGGVIFILLIALSVAWLVKAAHPLWRQLRLAEVPGAALIWLCGPRYRRQATAILARRREAARLLPPPRVSPALPGPRRVPASPGACRPPGRGHQARHSAAHQYAVAYAELTQALSAGGASYAAAYAELTRMLNAGSVSAAEARERLYGR